MGADNCSVNSQGGQLGGGAAKLREGACVCVHACMCVHACVCVCVHVSLTMCEEVCLHVGVSVHDCMCEGVSMGIMGACVSACMCV